MATKIVFINCKLFITTSYLCLLSHHLCEQKIKKKKFFFRLLIFFFFGVLIHIRKKQLLGVLVYIKMNRVKYLITNIVVLRYPLAPTWKLCPMCLTCIGRYEIWQPCHVIWLRKRGRCWKFINLICHQPVSIRKSITPLFH